MPTVKTFTVVVQFGDCDPAGMVFYPNFCRWMDAASLHFFHECGIPHWSELEPSRGIVGAPVMRVSIDFLEPVSYGERLTIHTQVEQWNEQDFVQAHRVQRGDLIVCEGREVRSFYRRTESGSLAPIAPPDDIRRLCT